jgi:uncharacterized protein (TIGR00369 family)
MDEEEVEKALRSAGIGELAETMGIEVELDGATVIGRMPVEGNRQPYGLLHGGATAVLVESIGSIAAALSAPGMLSMGIEISVSHHRAATRGHVTARTEAVHVGRTLASYVIPVVDDDGRRIATGRLTCLLRDPHQR